jgi:TetR/AcrR family transcriptional repressor of nem operon
LDESVSPVARLRAFVDDAHVGMARFDYRWGCLVGNPGQEISALPNPFRDRLATIFAD